MTKSQHSSSPRRKSALYFWGVLLWLAYGSSYLPPSELHYFFLLPYSFPFIAGLVLLLLIRRVLKRQHVVLHWFHALLVFLICVEFGSYFSLGTSEDVLSRSKNLHVSSYNAGSLMYKKRLRQDDNHDAIVDFARSEDPDIWCLQETFWKNWHPIFENIGESNSSYSILTDYPIAQSNILPLQEKGLNRFHFADIVWNSDTIRVYNLHFSSYHFGAKNYALFQEAETISLPDLWQRLKETLTLIYRGLVRKEDQLKQILPHIKQSPFPVIICGDFNDLPGSYTYRLFSSTWEDSFSGSGTGFGKTFIGLPLPLRIDYIFYSKQLSCTGFGISPKILSDHLMISAYFEFQ